MKYKIQGLYLIAVFMTTTPVFGQTTDSTNLKETPKTHSTNLQWMGVQELVRTRCSTDGADIYTEWTGSVYAFIPQQKQRKLFDIKGMNVARCLKNKQGQWYITSREVSFYLDPQTGKILDRWQNPWTGEVVPVVHIANNPVQSTFSADKYPVTLTDSNVIFVLDVLLAYPNVLASDPKFKDYSPEALYQAGEFFKLTAPLQEVTNSKATTAPHVSIDWMRIGPWLPWMKMKGQLGQLVYSTTARKLLHFEELSPWLKQEITSRVPLYRLAPRCFLARRNETSWTYFRQHFDAYLKGAQFPLPEAGTNEPCQM